MDSKILGIIGGIALLLALLSPLVLRNRNKVERTFKAAEELYERAEYADAIEKYNEVLAESNKTETINQDFLSHVNYKTAQCLRHLNKSDKALRHYRLIIVEFPDSQYATNSYVESGDIYFDRKDYENANEVYKGALSVTADEERKKQIYQKLQQLPIPQFPVMEEIDTRHFASLTEATSLRFEERFEAAAAQYEVFANTYLPVEEAVYALYWVGRCYYKANLFQQSVNAFERLINEYSYIPNAIEAYHGLAEAYYTWAEKDGDRSKYQSVISTVEQSEKKYTGKDDTKVDNWLRRMQAIKQKAIDNLPDPPAPPSPGAIAQQGLEHYRRGELDVAKRKAIQALNLNPNYSPARELLSKIKVKYYDRGLESLDANRYSEAINAFDKVISIDAQYKEAHFHLGVAYFNLSNYAYAENAVRAALDIDSEYEEARRLLAEITEGQD